MLLSVVLVSLLVSPVLSLRCFVCSSSATNEECNKTNKTCQPLLDTCMTVIDTLGQFKAIVKQCASQATCNGAMATASVDENGDGNTVHCCTGYNLCNFSGADSLRVHNTLMLLCVCMFLLRTH